MYDHFSNRETQNYILSFLCSISIPIPTYLILPFLFFSLSTEILPSLPFSASHFNSTVFAHAKLPPLLELFEKKERKRNQEDEMGDEDIINVDGEQKYQWSLREFHAHHVFRRKEMFMVLSFLSYLDILCPFLTPFLPLFFPFPFPPLFFFSCFLFSILFSFALGFHFSTCLLPDPAPLSSLFFLTRLSS